MPLTVKACANTLKSHISTAKPLLIFGMDLAVNQAQSQDNCGGSGYDCQDMVAGRVKCNWTALNVHA